MKVNKVSQQYFTLTHSLHWLFQTNMHFCKYLCIVAVILARPVQGGRVSSTETQDAQTQNYDKLLEDIRSGVLDDPLHVDPVKTELESVIEKSRFLLRCYSIKA